MLRAWYEKSAVVRSALIIAAVLGGPSSIALAAPCDTSNVLAGKAPVGSMDVNGDLSLVTDGAVGEDGASWNAPAGVTMQTAASSITYDLGEPRALAAFYMQGDANDTYTLSGSPDGTEGSFQTIGTFPNVIADGHGLRPRTLEIAPATVRYLRVAPGEGDTFFSITELAAYCRKPSPFPPTMRGGAAPAGEAAAAPDILPRWFLGLYGFGLLVLVWAALELRGRRA
jgi:hypothetical protein